MNNRGANDLHLAPEIQFTYELRDTSRLLLRLLSRRIAKHATTLSQYFLLRQLWEQDGIGQSVLAERIQATQPATVVIIDALEKRGLLERIRGVDDRRVERIHLTAAGQSMRAKLLEYAYELSTGSLDGLNVADAKKLRALLGRVRENLSTIDNEPADTIGA